jgi:lipoic acid synthetase
MMRAHERSRRLPPWFKVRLTTSGQFTRVNSLIMANKLHTVCRSAACPNQTECWNEGTATFMILGNVCTRGCRFCNVPKGKPEGLDTEEPARVAEAVMALKLKYAVITSVTRDDLPDGGAGFFALTVKVIRMKNPGCRVEVLIPDFQGSESALQTVLSARPDVLGHNVEIVPALYPQVRPQADYRRSLELLQRAKEASAMTKTGLMLGLGEGTDDVISVMEDLRRVGCDMLTLGQYLQPSKKHLPVIKYYEPEEFASLKAHADRLKFYRVVAGPLVRSSYHAEQNFLA